MQLRKSLTVLIAVLAVLTFVAACGGGQPAEEPAEEPTETPAAEPEPAVEPEPEPEEPEGPQLVGNINLSEDYFEWGEVTDRSLPAAYTWTVHVANDTTQTLDITVRFDFLDDEDGVVRTERATVRLAPAETTTINEAGSMSWDEANRVVGYATQVENWTIIEG